MADILATDHGTLSARAHAGLLTAGIGDALGAPTEQYSMAEIEATFGPGLIDRFFVPPVDTFAGAMGGRAGEITDDASQMYFLARALAGKGAAFKNRDWLDCLIDWHENSPKAGFMGPSTEALVLALKAGRDPSVFGRIGTSKRKMTNIGTTNGAAMRAAPIGMAHPGNLERTADVTLATCLPSHDASVAIEAACAISCGVSKAMVSDSVGEVVDACFEGARLGRRLAATHGRQEAGPRFQSRLDMALAIAKSGGSDRHVLERLEAEVGNSVLAAESVPCAIALFVFAQADPWRAVRLAATIGNDSDSIATMAGALSACLSGIDAVPQAIIEQFLAANRDFDLPTMARQLVGSASAA